LFAKGRNARSRSRKLADSKKKKEESATCARKGSAPYRQKSGASSAVAPKEKEKKGEAFSKGEKERKCFSVNDALEISSTGPLSEKRGEARLSLPMSSRKEKGKEKKGPY